MISFMGFPPLFGFWYFVKLFPIIIFQREFSFAILFSTSYLFFFYYYAKLIVIFISKEDDFSIIRNREEILNLSEE